MKAWALQIFGGLGAVILTLIFCSEIALAYPETIRYGYNKSCSTCHVSPSGGGVPNSYGRMAAEEWASFAPKDSGQLFAGVVKTPDAVVLGGDTRYISIKTPTFAKTFVMQNDVELALKPSAEMTFAATYGRYGIDGKPESRRNYVLWQPGKYVSVRLGRFLPAYGLGLADHTASVRGGIGFREGSESYNGEFVARAAFGELFVTGTVGDGTALGVKRDPGYEAVPVNPGALVKLSTFLIPRTTVGGSYWMQLKEGVKTHTYGTHVMYSPIPIVYMLGEWDRQTTDGTGLHKDVSYVELGVEAIRGIHLQATHEYQKGSIYGVGLQWFPVPHIEILARAKNQERVWSQQFLLHYNW